MIGAEYRNVVGIFVFDQIYVLKYRIRGTLVPFFSGAHLRGNGIDKVPEHAVEIPATRQMFDEGIGFELGEYLDLKDSRVDEIIEHEIDDAVFTAEVHRRFCALERKGMET